MCGRVSVLLGIYLGAGISGPRGNSMLNNLRNYPGFSQWLHHFVFPPAGYEGSNFSKSSPICVIAHVSDHNHPGGYEVVSPCLTRPSLMTNGVDHVFVCLLAIHIYFW